MDLKNSMYLNLSIPNESKFRFINSFPPNESKLRFMNSFPPNESRLLFSFKTDFIFFFKENRIKLDYKKNI